MEAKFWLIQRRGSTICVPGWLNGCISPKQIRKPLLHEIPIVCCLLAALVSPVSMMNICWFTGPGLGAAQSHLLEKIRVGVSIFLLWHAWCGRKPLVPDVRLRWNLSPALLGMRALERENAAFGGSAARQRQTHSAPRFFSLLSSSPRGEGERETGERPPLLFAAKKPPFLTDFYPVFFRISDSVLRREGGMHRKPSHLSHFFCRRGCDLRYGMWKCIFMTVLIFFSFNQ